MDKRNREVLFEGWSSDSKIKIVKTFDTIKNGEGNKNRYYLTKKRHGKHKIKLKINKTIADELLDNNDDDIIFKSFVLLRKKYSGNKCFKGPITEPIEDPR